MSTAHAPTRWQPPARRRVYLMRHGDVTYFDGAGKPYALDAVPLNAEGQRQAGVTREAFLDTPIDKVVCSGLPRTVQTAEIVSAGRPVPIHHEPALREIEPGDLRTMQPREINQLFLEIMETAVTPETRFLGGESFGDLLARVVPAFDRLLAANDWQHLLVVAHGAVNRALLCHLLGTGIRAWPVLEQDPCCVNLIDAIEDGRFVVRQINQTCYDLAKRTQTLTTMERIYKDFLRH